MKKIICIFSSLFSLVSCKVAKEDVIGLYVSHNNVNTIDSVWINEGDNYVNKIYRKADKSLIYKNAGRWQYSDGYIIFNDFYSEEDEIHTKEEDDFENVLITTKLPIEKRSGKVIFHHKAMYNNIYLEKVD